MANHAEYPVPGLLCQIYAQCTVVSTQYSWVNYGQMTCSPNATSDLISESDSDSDLGAVAARCDSRHIFRSGHRHDNNNNRAITTCIWSQCLSCVCACMCVCECVCHNGRRENKLPKTPPELSRTQAASEKLNESDRQSRARQGKVGRERGWQGEGATVGQTAGPQDSRTARQAGSQRAGSLWRPLWA